MGSPVRASLTPFKGSLPMGANTVDFSCVFLGEQTDLSPLSCTSYLIN